jgi:periplasmic protein TonB
MKREIIYSVILHVIALALTAVSFPLSHHRIDPGDVIKVTLSAGLPAPIRPQATPAGAAATPLPSVKAPAKESAKPIPDPRVKKPIDKAKPHKVIPGEDASTLAKAAEATEIKTQSTAVGSPFAGAAIDNPNFQYPDWFELAFRKIQVNWSNPVNIDGAVVCVVYFQVIRSGRVIEAKVDYSSGIPLFDQSCVSAVQKSSPFPPLPSDFADEVIGITLPFKYEPR